VFVRTSGEYTSRLDGRNAQNPVLFILSPGNRRLMHFKAISCDALKKRGKASGMYWVLTPGASVATDAIEVRCDMSGTVGVSLGNDG